MSIPQTIGYNIESTDTSKLFIGAEVSKDLIVPTYRTSCEISFHDNKNNKNFKFTPTEDITAYELAMLFKMFIHTTSGFNLVDISSYVKENGIGRHFTET
jgi:hypothetical protein